VGSASQQNQTRLRFTDVDLEPLAPILARLVQRVQPIAVWLFGSRAEGRARPDSDYDLLVIVADDSPAADLDAAGAYELTRGLGLPVDVVACPRSVFEQEKNEVNTLARAAFARGKLLYEQTT
jgi:predicted nucleotidyltransferase